MDKKRTRYRFGADIGGTFTDILLVDDDSGHLVALKKPSNRKTPEQSIVDGLVQLHEKHDVEPSEVSYFSHGTTLGVNTLLERDGVEVGLLTSKGFRDILELRRLRLPQANDLFAPRPNTLCRRRYVLELEERIGHNGDVILPLKKENVIAAARKLAKQGVENIALCFLHSYRFDAHEKQAKDWIKAEFPNMYVIASSDLWPQQREYERCLVSVINAYVGARMRDCFSSLKQKTEDTGLLTQIFSTKSNGGVMGLKGAGERPVETLLSGPASGVTGAFYVGQAIGETKMITLDMGGTSVDISIVDQAMPYSNENTVGEYPISMPAVDVSAIGAGGGSVAWLDPEGMLKVGPRSAGARPGPACYGLGGEEPTVTDAYAYLGILSPDGILGGNMRLDLGLAKQALKSLGDRLKLSAEQTADAILQVATANIYAEALPQIARRGIETSEFSLFCYGAAGPTHSFLLARELDLKNLIVPPMPGLLCALGCLVADLRADFVASLWRGTKEISLQELGDTYARLEKDARTWLDRQGVDVLSTQIVRSADMCFEGQSFELNIYFPNDLSINVPNIESWFRKHYKLIYGIDDLDTPIRLLEARTQIIGLTNKPDLKSLRPFGTKTKVGSIKRKIFENGKSYDATIYQRASLQPGDTFSGPAIVEQYDTTVYVPCGFDISIDAFWNIIGVRSA